ncbi:MAG TPA: non-ribosomal peptide synthetase [Pseudonocardiaceae bacterium]
MMSATTVNAAQPVTFPALIEAQVARTPDLPAVSWPGGELTYTELDERANRLAHLLITRGAGPGHTVALQLPRSLHIVVAALAVAKSGAAFLPIDPDYPADRIAFMLTDSNPIQVLTTTEMDTIDLTTMPTHTPTNTDRLQPLRLANTAYVIYTSGSTGQPKGVLIPHTGIANFTAAQIEHFGIKPGDRVLQFASPSFDASILELCLALPAGATLVVPPPGPLVGDDLATVLADQHITHALIPPVALATIPDDTELPEFHTVIVGGDACNAALVERWAPGRTLINAYGPTEVTIVATWSDPLTPGPQPPPIGRPITNTTIHLLDTNLHPVPIGVPGEIHITSPGLAHGYHNQPGLTAARFIAAPHGNRMYATGDLAHRDNHGQLHFHTRTDHQVKIRGHRIEPAEIETTLRKHPNITDAVVIPHEGRRLVAYVVGTADPGDLITFARRWLPDYMIPAAMVRIDALPLSPNGKLDRAQLPEPTVTTSGHHTPPSTETEAALAEIWADVLGTNDIGVDDNFFQLGGDSVRSVLITARAKATFDVTITPKDVLTAGTISALAELVEEQVLRELEQLAAADGEG